MLVSQVAEVLTKKCCQHSFSPPPFRLSLEADSLFPFHFLPPASPRKQTHTRTHPHACMHIHACTHACTPQAKAEPAYETWRLILIQLRRRWLLDIFLLRQCGSKFSLRSVPTSGSHHRGRKMTHWLENLWGHGQESALITGSPSAL